MSAESHTPAKDEIVKRMQAIRQQLPEEVQQVRGRVSELTSLRYYMRRYPIPLLGLAATAGYLIVPSFQPKQADSRASHHKSTKEQLAESSAKGSMVGGLIATAASLVLRKLLTSAVETAASRFSMRPHNDLRSTDNSDASSLPPHDLVSHDRYTR